MLVGLGAVYLLNGTNIQSSIASALSTTSTGADDIAYQLLMLSVNNSVVITGNLTRVVTVTESTNVTHYLNIYPAAANCVYYGRSMATSTNNCCKIIATRIG